MPEEDPGGPCVLYDDDAGGGYLLSGGAVPPLYPLCGCVFGG